MDESTEAIVLQMPYMVRLLCPFCEHENEYGYEEFCATHGDPPDWDYEYIDCEECGQRFQIDGQDWN